MADIAIVGAGSWGTALAVTLARTQRQVRLCVRRADHIATMSRSRENRIYLPGIALPTELELTAQTSDALQAATTIVMAVPSRFARAAWAPLACAIRPDATIVSVTKGIESDSLLTMTQLIAECAPATARIAALSGPGFAAEIAQGKPAALVAAARDERVAGNVQELFASRALRIYRSTDVIGVELGGAVKNVIAIAAGISDGLSLGASARAALITRGLAETTRLAVAAGARRETMAGLAGLGDLVLTCTGDLSRNRRLGFRIARGAATPPAADGEPIAEGLANARSLRKLAQRLGVEMPIVSAVERVLYEGAPANAMVEELLCRELKAEF